ncbi:hypothetical protein [Streptomyces sp. NBC_00582]|uniref:hypothetical protein n=1 Tax=Streptomyces sp. NBC_00582 TaxID=2975783 RepID=UPI002E7FB581|nr:hypothetical protein [Streptomyces sp. NBC_00582]WUB68595.1 hypothetical protein OG852_50755 [Streptomyces sp. NBC_00582]
MNMQQRIRQLASTLARRPSRKIDAEHEGPNYVDVETNSCPTHSPTGPRYYLGQDGVIER